MHVDEIRRLEEEPAAALPLFLSAVPAGFPNQAEDAVEQALDLNALLVTHPAATFFVRVSGRSMENANIFSGDVLIVDRAIEATSGRIVVAVIAGEFTVKRLIRRKGKVLLMSEHVNQPPQELEAGDDFQVWGVVTYIIHAAK